jgi:spermidine/putrescine-binding protein
MKNGIFNLNTTNPSQINAAGKSLEDLAHLTNVHIDNNDYTLIPSGQIWIHHAWSGDIAAAPYYLPKGVNVRRHRLLVPARWPRPGRQRHDHGAQRRANPVLAHLFLNYMLDFNNVMTNISFNGYMQPINGVTPQRLVKSSCCHPT